MAINPEIMQQIRAEIQTAPHGHKTALIKRRAEMYGVSEATIWRGLELKARTRKGVAKRPELRIWAMVVAMIKKRPPSEAGEISTDQAMKIAVRSANAPSELLAVHPATIDRVMRQLGTNKKSIRAVRFQAKEPNQAHQFDASTSAFLHIARTMPDGNHVLKVHRPAAGGYKNKPIPADRLRPIYYAVCDDHSGVRLARLIPGMGENARDSTLALDGFWRVLGMPKKILADGGALKKCLGTNEYVHACGIELPPSTPYHSRTRGKIERTFRTMWQRFEKQVYAPDDWEKLEFSLSEANAMLDKFLAEENQRRHRFERKITRMDAWRRVMLKGGITVPPEDAILRAHELVKRKVGIDGLVWIENIPYEVAGNLCNAWVYVYRAMFHDRMVVEDISTGERYEVKNFKPLDENEFKAFKDTPHQIAVKASAALHIPRSAMLFGEDHASESVGDNVVSLPIRRTEIEVASVFGLERYASVEDGWNDVCAIVGPRLWHESERRDMCAVIEKNDLNKEAIRAIAREIGEAEEQRKAMAL
jgi:transposase InsO family protein